MRTNRFSWFPFSLWLRGGALPKQALIVRAPELHLAQQRQEFLTAESGSIE
jgi:hypothetical protein